MSITNSPLSTKFVVPSEIPSLAIYANLPDTIMSLALPERLVRRCYDLLPLAANPNRAPLLERPVERNRTALLPVVTKEFVSLLESFQFCGWPAVPPRPAPCSKRGALRAPLLERTHLLIVMVSSSLVVLVYWVHSERPHSVSLGRPWRTHEFFAQAHRPLS
jgi:hypothetical protein